MADFFLHRCVPTALIIALFGLSGCASRVRDSAPPATSVPAVPAASSLPAPASQQVSVPATSVQAEVQYSSVPASDSHQNNGHLAQQQQSGPATAAATDPVPTAESYNDLFDRIRAGFQLKDVDQIAVDRELAWYASHTQYLDRTFARGERYLYYIVSQLEARKMPLELALLPVVESAFEPFGYSRARASGLWQFIPGTGSRYGLKQNWWYDGRRDVVHSTRAALDYLQFLHAEFGDWQLAVAAYNCGEQNVQRAINANLAANKPTDFWSLKLPKETRAYVPKLLAMRRLVSDPAAHGVELGVIPNEPFFAVVDTGGQIDLHMASELAGVTPEELTYLNPGFNRWATDPDGPHHLLLPVATSELFAQSLAQVPQDERLRVTRHQVGKGETLASIARRYGVKSSVVMQMNGLSSSRLRKGQDLLLPVGGSALHPKVAAAAARIDSPAVRSRGRSRGKGSHVVRSGDTLWGIAQRHGVSVETLASLNGMSPGDKLHAGRKLVVSKKSSASVANKSSAGDGKRLTYTVRSGDTLFDIARRFSVSVTQILSWNGLSKGHLLKPGQRLVMYLTG